MKWMQEKVEREMCGEERDTERKRQEKKALGETERKGEER